MIEALLNKYLIPDLTKIVLSYAWKKNGNFYDHCYYGNYEKVRQIITNGSTSKWSLKNIKNKDPMEAIKSLTEKRNNNWSKGFQIAGIHEYISIVKLLILNKKIKEDIEGLNKTLCAVCRYGLIDVVKLLIENGANNLNGGLQIACRYNHPNIVNLLLEKGANDFDGSLYCAWRGKNFELMELMIQNGATYNLQIYSSLISSRLTNKYPTLSYFTY